MEALVELLKLTLPAAAVLYGMYLVVRGFVVRDLESRRQEVRSRGVETILPSRIQAYERICLLMERMSPQNLLVRVAPGGLSAKDYQRLLLEEIRNEYNHNAAQQIYMSEEVWVLVRNSREDLVMTINEAASEMPEEASGLDLARKIMERFVGKPVDPMGHALLTLKKEVQQLF